MPSEPDGLARFVSLLREELQIERPISGDTPLLTSGLIDSFDMVSLIAIIEAHFGVSIAPEELDAESFDTPAQMLAFVDAASS